MKAFKKTLIVFLSLVMILSVVAMPISAAEAKSFTDVTEKDWFYDSVMRWTNAGVINGKTEDTFAPNAPMKRGEFAKVMAEVLGLSGNYASVFEDKGHWSDEYVTRCHAEGIVNGTPVGDKIYYYPEQEITREQAFAMMVRALNINAGDEKVLASFTDAHEVSDWAKEENSAATMITYGAVVGNPDGSLNPKGAITRAEVVKILDRLVGVHVSKEGVVTTATADTDQAIETGAKQCGIVVVHSECQADVQVTVEIVEEEVVNEKGETVVVEKQAVAVQVTDKKGISTQAQMIPTNTTTKVDEEGKETVEQAEVVLVTATPKAEDGAEQPKKENVVVTAETKVEVTGTNSKQETVKVEVSETCAKHTYEEGNTFCLACGECGHGIKVFDNYYTEDVHHVHCAGCGKIFAEAHAFKDGVCSVCEYKEGECLHNYELKVDEKSHTLTCVKCGEVEKEFSGEHEYNPEGYCEFCGYEPDGCLHTNVLTDVHGNKTCVDCEFVLLYVEGCSPDPYTCKCIECGKCCHLIIPELTEKTHHFYCLLEDCDFDEPAQEHSFTEEGWCLNCGYMPGNCLHKEYAEDAHGNYVCSDCGNYLYWVESCTDKDEDFKCDVCDRCLHAFTMMPTETTHYLFCMVPGCGETEERGAHTYNEYGRCSECGYAPGDCLHENLTTEVHGDLACKDCGERVGWLFDCIDADGDNKCDKCGECVHTNTETDAHGNVICVDCDAYVRWFESCDYTEENPICSICGRCIHSKQTVTNDEKTHTFTCDICKEVVLTGEHEFNNVAYGEGEYCVLCGYHTNSEQPTEHTHAWDNGTVTKAATCTEKGVKTFKCACGETKTEEIAALGHTEVKVDAVAATCTETGLTEGKKCSVCGTVTVAQETVSAKGHTEETVAGKDATCTETGLTEGKKCSVCEEVLVKQEVVSALGHTEVTVEGKYPTCTEEGLTVGIKCSVCGTFTKEQVVLQEKGHDMVESKAAVAPTCTAAGKTAILVCDNDCGKTEGGEEVAALGHKWTDATCTTAKTCSVCKATEGEALGHKWDEGVKEANFDCEKGYKITYSCKSCSETKEETVEATTHTYAAGNRTCSVCTHDVYAAIGTVGYTTLEDAIEAAETDDVIVLAWHYDAPESIVVSKEVTIDLNGYNVSASADTAGDGVFHVVEGGDLTINGEGEVNGVCASTYHMAIWADGGDVTINGGTYTNIGAQKVTPNDDQFDLIYAKNGSIITINDGMFEADGDPKWTLNLKDNSDSRIIVKGGTYVGYDPSNAASENPVANLVAEGYYAEKIKDCYVIQELDVNSVDTECELLAAIKVSNEVTLTSDIDAEKSIVIDKAVTINLNECDVSASADTAGDGVFHVVEGGDLTINGEGVVDGNCASDYDMAIWADGGNVTINGGTYTNVGAGEDDHYDLIYAKKGGKVIINGGTFICETPKWTLNSHDSETGTFDVKGGTFHGYNPSNSDTEPEGADNNFVAMGYVAVPNKDESEYTVHPGDVYVSDASDLTAKVEAGETNLWLMPGEYDIDGCGGKTLTLNGSKDVVITPMNEGEDGCDYGFGSAGDGVGDVTFNGVTIDTTHNTGNYKGFAYMKGTFNDCNFEGAYSLNNANDFVFNRCTFDFQNGYFWTWGANSVTFNECTFGGNSKNILAHGWASTEITINNCDFAATEKGYASNGTVWTAAVEIDPAGTNTYTINFTGENTLSEYYSGWTRVKDGSTGHTITGIN